MITGNNFIHGKNSVGSDYHLELTDNAWLTFDGNSSAPTNSYSPSVLRNFVVKYQGVNGALIPLRGVAGIAPPTNGRQEVVLGYGGGWSTGDSVVIKYQNKINAWVFGQDFNSFDELKAKIAAVPGLAADDYGAFLQVKTNHLRISETALPASAAVANDAIVLYTRTRLGTAGVYLRNLPVTFPASGPDRIGRQFSRGGSTDGNRCVAWSPYVNLNSVVSLSGFNLCSSQLLASGYARKRALNDDGACAELELAVVPAGCPAAGLEWGIR